MTTLVQDVRPDRVSSLGIPVDNLSGTTLGYTDDYDEVCPYEMSTSPDVVYTFDWRHGAYCHPEHRAIGWLVSTAVHLMGPDAPRLELVASTVWENAAGWGFRPMVMIDDTVKAWDGTRHLASIDGDA